MNVRPAPTQISARSMAGRPSCSDAAWRAGIVSGSPGRFALPERVDGMRLAEMHPDAYRSRSGYYLLGEKTGKRRDATTFGYYTSSGRSGDVDTAIEQPYVRWL